MKNLTFPDDPNSGIKWKIQQLKSDWSNLSGPERADRLAEILFLGISKRELARKLDKNEGTIRACIKAYKPRPIIAGDPADARPLSSEDASEKIPETVPSTSVPHQPPGPAAIASPPPDRPHASATMPQPPGEFIVMRALAAARYFLDSKVDYCQALERQLLELVLDRIRGAEAFGTLPAPAPFNVPGYSVILQSASKEPYDLLMEHYVDQLARGLCRLVPNSDDREYVLRCLLNYCDPLHYPLAKHAAA